MTTISGASALADFRLKNDGEHILSLLETHSNILINWDVGVGKSTNMDGVINTAIVGSHYDLVIALLPTRAVIDEREYIKHPPKDIKVVNIRPRPTNLCGEKRNNYWLNFERRGLASIGKSTICALCPNKNKCFWPKQYGKELRGSQVIYATQAHLKNNPNFIAFMKEQSKANKVLVIFDEATVSLTSYSRTIEQEHLTHLLCAINQSSIKADRKATWTRYIDSLLNATTEDLRMPDVWALPALFPNEVREVLAIGEQTFGKDFHNITNHLVEFSKSPLGAREKTEYGDLRFPATPQTDGCDVLLYSGTTDARILNMRLGLNFHNHYENYSFKGENTQWLNIASSLGTMTNFIKNSPQILDFFLELILQRIEQGKRVLLISKKKLSEFCINKLNMMLALRGIADIKVVPGNDEYEDDGTTKYIPLIHYGIIGINKFEYYDCVYCLNSYYTTKDILSSSIQDMRATDEQIDVEINMTHTPRRRYAKVADNKYRYTDVADVADFMLNTLEMGVVIQAIGRVRPFTNSREIITFQNNEVPTYPYDHEFSNLEGIRAHFDINTKQKRNTLNKYDTVQALKIQGFNQKQTAEKLQMGVRTVRRYWPTEKVDTTP
ncbi:hypothetical protein [uncultured Psychromonas sp.]|uniref:hypothetical protein n=1 Tax=uncultured Psychromonas sp. TaxID=173974 RepID=UPI0026061AB6|nr:hypothetical protein [uncultured Psychromonas sp.]